MQVMRIATFDVKPVVDEARLAEFLAWMSSQPGLRVQYHAHYPATGLSVSVWESRDHMMAMRERVPPSGPLGLKPDNVTIYDVDDAR